MNTPQYFLKFTDNFKWPPNLEPLPNPPSEEQFQTFLELLSLEDWTTLISDLAERRPWPGMMKHFCPSHELLEAYAMDFQEVSGHSARLIEDACTNLALEHEKSDSDEKTSFLRQLILLTRLIGWGIAADTIKENLLKSSNIPEDVRLSAAFALVTHRDPLPLKFWMEGLNVQMHPSLALARIAAICDSEPLKAFETFELLQTRPNPEFDRHAYQTLEGLLIEPKEFLEDAVRILGKLSEPVFDYIREIILASFREPRLLDAISRRTQAYILLPESDDLGNRIRELRKRLLLADPKTETLENLSETITDHALGRVASELGLLLPHNINLKPYRTEEQNYFKIYEEIFSKNKLKHPALVITPPNIIKGMNAESTQVAVTNSYTGFALVGPKYDNLEPCKSPNLVTTFTKLMAPIMKRRPQVAIIDKAAGDFLNITKELYRTLAQDAGGDGPAARDCFELRSSGDPFVAGLRGMGHDRTDFFIGPASSRLLATSLNYVTYVTYSQVKNILNELVEGKERKKYEPMLTALKKLTVYNCWNLNISAPAVEGNSPDRALAFQLAAVAHRVSDVVHEDRHRIIRELVNDWNGAQQNQEYHIKRDLLEELFDDFFVFYRFENIDSHSRHWRSLKDELGTALAVHGELQKMRDQFIGTQEEFDRKLRSQNSKISHTVKERALVASDLARAEGQGKNYLGALRYQKAALEMIQYNSPEIFLN